MKAKRQFYNLIFSVFGKVFSVLYLSARGTFFCDRHHLMEALHNVSGISEKRPQAEIKHFLLCIS